MSTKMKPCHNCGHLNPVGADVCSNCGAEKPSRITSEIPSQIIDRLQSVKGQNTQDTVYVKQEKRHFRPGTSVFEEGMLLRLEIEGSDDAILVQPMEGGIIVLGRHDADDSYQPDVDLNPYMARQHGISRRHAAITYTSNRVEIRDLRSSNGTYLNGVILDPNEPHQMRDGDSVRLAGLSITVHFQD